LNLERSIANFEKKLNRVDPILGTRNKTGLGVWKGRQIIPLDDWIELKDTPDALRYFPDDFDQTLTCMSGDEKVGTQQEQEDLRKWDSDYQELMGFTKNPNYGRLKWFYCLLSPDGDDPIFIGINRLVAKGLNNDALQGDREEYPCQVVNRFQCPFERNAASRKDTTFDVDDLFRLHELAFAVEVSLAKARKDDSVIKIKNKEQLLHAFTDKETFGKILEQGAQAEEVGEDIKRYLMENRTVMLDYFMRLKDIVNTEDLRFY
jgi:hypothetical protein